VAVNVQQGERLSGGTNGKRARQTYGRGFSRTSRRSLRGPTGAAAACRVRGTRLCQHGHRLGQRARTCHATGEPQSPSSAAILVEEDVRRLQVAMDEDAVVELRQARREPWAMRDVSALAGARRQPPSSVPPCSHSSAMKRAGLGLAVVLDAHDVSRARGRPELRLTLEPASCGRREDLQRDGAVERVCRARAIPRTSARGPEAHRAGFTTGGTSSPCVSDYYGVTPSVGFHYSPLEEAQQRVMEARWSGSRKRACRCRGGWTGRAEDVRARVEQQPFARSAMDGAPSAGVDLPGELAHRRANPPTGGRWRAARARQRRGHLDGSSRAPPIRCCCPIENVSRR